MKPENFYPDLELLKQIYAGWKIIKFDKGFTEIEEHDNLKQHRHNLIFFIAHLAEGIVWGGIVALAIKFLGPMFGLEDEQADALALGSFGGIV